MTDESAPGSRSQGIAESARLEPRDIGGPALLTKANRPRQLDSLTGLRFLAAFFVLIAHACEWVAPFRDASALAHYGGFLSVIGMPLFFVLSGFVIHYNYGQSFARMRFRWAASEFLAARFARLYPLLVVCFAVGLVVDCTYNWFGPHTGWWLQLVAGFLTMTQSWFYVVIFENRILMSNAYGLAWSVSTEFFFYVAYTGLAFLFLRLWSLRSAIVAWVVFSVAALAWFIEAKAHLIGFAAFAKAHLSQFISVETEWSASFVRWFFYYSPYSRIFEFVLGCLTAQVYNLTRDRIATPAEERWASVAMWASLAALGLISVFYLSLGRYPVIHDYVQFLSLNFICAVPIAVLIYCVSSYETCLSRLLCAAPAVALGELSYSIYSVHTWTLRIFIRDPANYSTAGGIDAVARVALAIGVTLVLSTATYRLIEMPARSWLRGFFSSRLVAAFGPRIANLRHRAPGTLTRAAAIGSLFLLLGLCIAYQATR